MRHVQDPTIKTFSESNDIELPTDCLINLGKLKGSIMTVCITMYNEPFIQLLQTLAGVYRAYYELVDWKDEFLDKVQIIIVADGYEKLSTEFLTNLEKVGMYNSFCTSAYKKAEYSQDKTEYNIKYQPLNFINHETMDPRYRVYDTNNVGHCFSRLMYFPEWLNCLSDKDRSAFDINGFSWSKFLRGSSKAGLIETQIFHHIPMQCHFLIKHQNKGKIESHKWFFRGFCEYLNPTYAQILDCGSIPLQDSISSIVKYMERNKTVGAASGEIEVILSDKDEHGNDYSFFENLLLRCQYVEYKLSNYLDKAMESDFGFISVLPGAFSTFRWECINDTPLQKFLSGAKDEFNIDSYKVSCAEANKNLAEDRIMCLEILARHGNWIINYIPTSKCLTDPPTSLTGLIKQRRRWFNGSLFATFYTLRTGCRVMKNVQCNAWCRNFLFLCLYLYMFVMNMLSFVLVGFSYAVFSMFVRSVMPSSDDPDPLMPANLIENLYLLGLVLTMALSGAVNIEWAETGYRICSFIFGIFSFIMVA